MRRARREIGFSTPERYNASAILYDNLAANGWRPAVIGPAGTRTYAELAADAAAFGAGLLSLGLQRGDRVLLFLDDTPAYPAALFGAIRAGLVPLLINTLTPSDLLQFYLSDSGATVAVADAAFADRFNATACDGTKLENPRRHQRRGGAAGPVATQSAAPWLAGPAPALAPADTHRDDMAFWMYSSGSTGRPKGIVHLQHDMAYTHLSYARHLLGLSERDVCFSVPEDLLRLRHGQLDHLPVRGRAHRACCCPASRAPPPSLTALPATNRPCSSACRRSTPR